jgi:ferredoxin--NADP+ reductase
VTENRFKAAVIGAGPAGMFAARELARNGVEVSLFNRDIKPGGLAEYGIYPDKHAMKEGLRNQFRQILEIPEIHYYGNVVVGQHADLTLDDLRGLGYQAILVTVGAQGTKKLGLPGEDLPGVYHAKDIVFHYNQLPPYSKKQVHFGKKVAIVGAGNVMMDITRFLIQKKGIQEVTAIVRRGPLEVKFDKKEMEELVLNLDQDAFAAEVERIAPRMRAVDQEVERANDFIEEALPKAHSTGSSTRFKFRFLSTPSRIDGDGVVRKLVVEENELVLKGEEVGIRSTGVTHELDFDSVVFAIGDTVEPSFGLPVVGGEFAKNPSPRYPMEEISFEAFDPEKGMPIADVFVAGWARKASSGLVGYARRDGTMGARAILQFLNEKQPLPVSEAALLAKLAGLNKSVVRNNDVLKLDMIEHEIAQEKGLRSFKFSTNEEMLERIMSIG